VSSSMYRSIFVTDFNLGFGNPRTDTSSVARRCQVMLWQITRHTLMKHFDSKLLTGSQLESNGSAVYVTFDLQKTLPLPKLSVGQAFYMRQLWLYNTCIHTADQEGPFFHIWTEAEAHRGVKEICSSLFTFLSTADICDDKNTLIAWSDSCPGQNKNFAMIAFWQYILLKNASPA